MGAMSEQRSESIERRGESAWERIKLSVNAVFLLLLLGSIVPVVYLTGFSSLLINRDRSARDGGKVQLRFMFWGGPEQLVQEIEVHDAFKAYLKDIGREDIEVELLPASMRYWSKLQAMMSGHQTPDVFMVAPGSIAKFADREQPLMVDITDRVVREIAEDAALPAGARKELDFADLLPEAMKTFYCNGRLYGFPRDYKTTGLGYNADLLAQAGLEDPNDLFARNEWTWEKFLEYLQKLTGQFEVNGERQFVFGLFQDSFNEAYWHNILLQAGGGLWTDDSRDLLIDAPESVRGLQFVYDLAWKYNVAKPYTPELGASNPWRAQETAMLGFRGWHLPEHVRYTYTTQSKKFNYAWDVAPWPLGPVLDYTPTPMRDSKGRTTGWRLSNEHVVLPGAVHWINGVAGQGPFRLRGCTATGIGYCMSVDSPHQDEAWILLKFLVGPEAQWIRGKYDLDAGGGRTVTIPGPNMPSRMSLVQKYLDLGRNNPIRPTFTGSLEGKNRQEMWPNVKLFIDARDYGRAATGQLGMDEIMREVQRYFDRMLMNPDYKPEDLARDSRARADKVYARLREGIFPSSYSDPSLVRPPGQDPLGLAPGN